MPEPAPELSTTQAAARLSVRERFLRTYLNKPELTGLYRMATIRGRLLYRIPVENLDRIADILTTLTGEAVAVRPEPTGSDDGDDGALIPLFVHAHVAEALAAALRVIEAQRQEIERLREAQTHQQDSNR